MIPAPTFDDRGQYVLDTLEQRAAAMFAALGAVAVTLIARHGQGPEVQATEMAKIATDLIRNIRISDQQARENAMERVARVLDDRKGYHVDVLDPETRDDLLGAVVDAARGAAR